ncbi:PI-stichotoxin-Hcr2f-like [Anthonomus grandis grandis]|uniref:PI-stichotoxin-Hcr2f-like n=1 Tax=Anthonomus grandis grandis TaxID=2921223 RepID=UPI00216560D2|nr:PI-stichotoxin-Hcr2f-like [Anthonomus grandis grandis]
MTMMTAKLCAIIFLLALMGLDEIHGARSRRGPSDHPSYCDLRPETGPCRMYLERYYYDPSTRTCKMFIYGGCRGNKNNFETLRACYRICYY